jgi:hypothetical protein
MAGVVGELLGRTVTAVKRDVEEWAGWARNNGWQPWSIEAYRKMCAHYDAHGYPGGNPVVLTTILGRAPGTFRAFAQRFIAEQKS